MGACNICKRALDDPQDPTTLDCGGDCLKCMADIALDDDCIRQMATLTKEDKYMRQVEELDGLA